jgi:DNA modification methylase
VSAGDVRVVRYHGDALEALSGLADDLVDAIVTDPPYELGFMGHTWDASGIAYNVELWKHCLRVLKPGGHLLAFGGTRTAHRMACAIEDAGFEIRDSIAWLYGSGFPKSLDVSKAIDKRRDDGSDVARVAAWLADQAEAAAVTRAHVDAHMGTSDMAGWWLSRLPHRAQVPQWDQWLHLRELIGFSDEMDIEVWRLNGRKGTPGEPWANAEVLAIDERWNEPGVVNAGQGDRERVSRAIKAPATDDAKRWAGWGTALKPAHEPIVVARKPLVGTVAANVLAHGTGALNIDACRVGDAPITQHGRSAGQSDSMSGPNCAEPAGRAWVGRWPANVALDEVAAAELDEQSGTLKSGANPTRRSSDKFRDAYGEFAGQEECTPARGADAGGASRFFPVFRYQAKAPTRERPEYWRPSCNCETVKPWPDQSPQRAIDASESGVGKSWSTSTSGSGSTAEQFPTGTTSITGMATSSTMTPEIFNSSQSLSTSASIPDANSAAMSGGSPAVSVDDSSRSTPSIGISRPKDGRSTVAADPATLSEWSETSVCVNCGAPARREAHATVKPLDLMRWLVRLATPPDGIVLDPFAGSGTTLEAAVTEGMRCIGIEQSADYLPLIDARMTRAGLTAVAA